MLSRKTPVLQSSSITQKYHIQDVNRAGGIIAIMDELAKMFGGYFRSPGRWNDAGGSYRRIFNHQPECERKSNQEIFECSCK